MVNKIQRVKWTKSYLKILPIWPFGRPAAASAENGARPCRRREPQSTGCKTTNNVSPLKHELKKINQNIAGQHLDIQKNFPSNFQIEIGKQVRWFLKRSQR